MKLAIPGLLILASSTLADDSIATAFKGIADGVTKTDTVAKAWRGSYSYKGASDIISAGRKALGQIKNFVAIPDPSSPSPEVLEERQEAAMAMASSFNKIRETSMEKAKHFTGLKSVLRPVVAGIISSSMFGVATIGKAYVPTCEDQQACQAIFDEIDNNLAMSLELYS